MLVEEYAAMFSLVKNRNNMYAVKDGTGSIAPLS